MVKSEDLPVQLVKAYQDLIRIEHCSSVSDESGAPASRCTIESFAVRDPRSRVSYLSAD